MYPPSNYCTLLTFLGPIPPGSSFTYSFRATSYGHTWYHSHFSLQYPDGIVGPIIINGPSSANWDVDLGPLSITDWFHIPASQLFFAEEQPGLPIPGDTGLVQGKNTWNESGEYYDMTFTPGKKHRIRLVNMSTNTHFKFSIDQHTMTVMAADFVPIEPYDTTVLNIGIGITPALVITADLNQDNDTILSSRQISLLTTTGSDVSLQRDVPPTTIKTESKVSSPMKEQHLRIPRPRHMFPTTPSAKTRLVLFLLCNEISALMHMVLLRLLP